MPAGRTRELVRSVLLVPRPVSPGVCRRDSPVRERPGRRDTSGELVAWRGRGGTRDRVDTVDVPPHLVTGVHDARDRGRRDRVIPRSDHGGLGRGGRGGSGDDAGHDRDRVRRPRDFRPVAADELDLVRTCAVQAERELDGALLPRITGHIIAADAVHQDFTLTHPTGVGQGGGEGGLASTGDAWVTSLDNNSRHGVGGVRGRGDGDATKTESSGRGNRGRNARSAHDDSLLPVFQAGLRLQRGLSPRGDAPRA